jgi:transposase
MTRRILNPADAYDAYRGGAKYREIAVRFGVSTVAAWRAVQREARKRGITQPGAVSHLIRSMEMQKEAGV